MIILGALVYFIIGFAVASLMIKYSKIWSSTGDFIVIFLIYPIVGLAYVIERTTKFLVKHPKKLLNTWVKKLKE